MAPRAVLERRVEEKEMRIIERKAIEEREIK